MSTKLQHSDEIFMQRCLQLAQKGLGKTYPNPLVGCVVVHNQKIIGEGWHQAAGSPHAEVHAIAAVENKDLLSEATLYVNLEPCNHHGKTPPCVDLILKYHLKKVVIGSLDPNPIVAGTGVARLRENNCEVRDGILEKECAEINRRFFTYHTQKRPYILLKWAESQNGYIAPNSAVKEREVFWLSDSYSQQLVHQWRSEEQSILVGINTVKTDNPKLSVRKWTGKNPIPIVLDPSQQLHDEDALFHHQKLIHISARELAMASNSTTFNFSEMLTYLYNQNIQSVLVEGGAFTLQQFIDAQLWDEIRLLKTASELSEGLLAPKIRAQPLKKVLLHKDALHLFRNKALMPQTNF